eukprot:5888448-Pyramimonas_sp.AAC.1
MGSRANGRSVALAQVPCHCSVGIRVPIWPRRTARSPKRTGATAAVGPRESGRTANLVQAPRSW